MSLSARHVRKEMTLTVWVLLLEKATQEFVERRVWEILLRTRFGILGGCVSLATLRDGYVDHRWRYLLHQRREALLLNERNRRGHRLRRRNSRWRRICAGRVFRPNQRRERQSRAQSK